jgi:hypothetical protein
MKKNQTISINFSIKGWEKILVALIYYREENGGDDILEKEILKSVKSNLSI